VVRCNELLVQNLPMLSVVGNYCVPRYPRRVLGAISG